MTEEDRNKRTEELLKASEDEGEEEYLSSKSFMLKHLIDRHEGEKFDAKMFGVKILKFTKSSFERQILESVLIQENREHN